MKDDEEHRLEIAAFRYRVIVEAVDAEGEGVTEALRQAAGITYSGPGGRELRFGLSTLWSWLAAYRRGGLLALRPASRKDQGRVRAIPADVLEAAASLRRAVPERPTRTVIDILVRKQLVKRPALSRSTLDRYFSEAGLARRALRTLGTKTFRLIESSAPFELVMGDFHHGPYVRFGPGDEARRALFGGFIDHFSRYVPEGRYYLHEDFIALRFGFRRLITAYGLPVKLFKDGGGCYRANRFLAACGALGIHLPRSKPYHAEARGCIERFNGTLKSQFESEVRYRETLPTLDELNAWFEAWLAERYHRDVHSETAEAPAERFERTFLPRPAPVPEVVDEYLRLRENRTVHKKWSTVEVEGIRFTVHPSLRGRRVGVLFDPLDPEYVLISHKGQIVERAYPQKPGAEPPLPEPTPKGQDDTDYLALLRADYERRVRTDLSALRLAPGTPAAELDLAGFVAALEKCRTQPLSDPERFEASAVWRRLRPIEPDAARAALDRVRRQQGEGLHLRVYLDALHDHLVRIRTRKGEKK